MITWLKHRLARKPRPLTQQEQVNRIIQRAVDQAAERAREDLRRRAAIRAPLKEPFPGAFMEQPRREHS